MSATGDAAPSALNASEVIWLGPGDQRTYEHLVTFERLTCSAAPQQYEGTVLAECWFYWRLRNGRAQLGLGRDLDDAVEATFGRGAGLGYAYESIDSIQLERADYEASFLRLLGRIVRQQR